MVAFWMGRKSKKSCFKRVCHCACAATESDTGWRLLAASTAGNPTPRSLTFKAGFERRPRSDGASQELRCDCTIASHCSLRKVRTVNVDPAFRSNPGTANGFTGHAVAPSRVGATCTTAGSRSFARRQPSVGGFQQEFSERSPRVQSRILQKALPGAAHRK